MSERTDPTRQAAQRLLGLAGPYRGETFEADHEADVRLVAEAVMERNNQSIIGARSAENAETCARDSGEPSYPATPVDCLISELRDLFGMNGRAYLMKDDFEARLAQFKEEVQP